MLRSRTPFLLLLALLAPVSSTGQPIVHLAWDDCGSYGTAYKDFACDTNAGSDVLVCSFIAPAGLDSLYGFDVSMIFDSGAYPPPPWWSMQIGGCRGGALSTSFDFTAGPTNCYDYWGGQAAGGSEYVVGYCDRYDPKRCYSEVRYRCVAAIQTFQIRQIAAGTEVYLFKVQIKHVKTVGLGACAGCVGGACISVSEVLLAQTPTLGDIDFYTGADPPRVSWNGGTATAHAHGQAFPCSAATPARRHTWGEIKSLYR